MNIWKQLYAMVWLAFLQIVLITVGMYVPDIKIYVVYGHTFLGLVILGLAHYNGTQIKRTEAPSRLKRIVKSTAALATLQIIFGIILFLNAIHIIGIPFIGVVAFFHIVTALAIITQASSVATAYDMWEEKEYTK